MQEERVLRQLERDNIAARHRFAVEVDNLRHVLQTRAHLRAMYWVRSTVKREEAVVRRCTPLYAAETAETRLFCNSFQAGLTRRRADIRLRRSKRQELSAAIRRQHDAVRCKLSEHLRLRRARHVSRPVVGGCLQVCFAAKRLRWQAADEVSASDLT